MTPLKTFCAIVVAAGKGARMGGGEPKQYRRLLGRSVLAWSVAEFLTHPECACVVVVHPEGEARSVRDHLPTTLDWGRIKLTGGGATRTASVKAGLKRVDPCDAVLIHDAARPGVEGRDIDALLAALATADMAAPSRPIVDALKWLDDQRLETRSRDGLYAVQTPQAFRYDALIRAYASVEDEAQDDDLAIGSAVGLSFSPTPGRDRLSKLTYPEDIQRLEALMASDTKTIRVGQGFDVHAFAPGDRVILCGVPIPHNASLQGHSDADVAWHCLTDAILGAAALGDIGDHFPPSDPQWKGAASEVFLAKASHLISERGGEITNVDLTIVCEAPKVKPHRDAMRRETARVLRLPLDAVSVKATTTEGLGFTGRNEGIAAFATATIAFPR